MFKPHYTQNYAPLFHPRCSSGFLQLQITLVILFTHENGHWKGAQRLDSVGRLSGQAYCLTEWKVPHHALHRMTGNFLHFATKEKVAFNGKRLVVHIVGTV